MLHLKVEYGPHQKYYSTAAPHRTLGMNASMIGTIRDSVKNPAEMILIADGKNSSPGVSNYYCWEISRIGARQLSLADYIYIEKVNVLFLDGHVGAKGQAFMSINGGRWDPNLQ